VSLRLLLYANKWSIQSSSFCIYMNNRLSTAMTSGRSWACCVKLLCHHHIPYGSSSFPIWKIIKLRHFEACEKYAGIAVSTKLLDSLSHAHAVWQWRTEGGVWGVQTPPPRNSEDIGGVLDRMSKKNRRLDFLL